MCFFNIKTGFIIVFSILFFSCKKGKTIEIENTLDLARTNEIISISLVDIEIQTDTGIMVRDEQSGDLLQTQLMDTNKDGKYDVILFQPELKSLETKKYTFLRRKNNKDRLECTTFARFVPERMDDFAWENDKVAFRVYGPKAQQMVENGTPGGIISSGVDCWLKRVKYPIIDKWYHNALELGKSYHEDWGEGLDNYHVGPSRGCGGTGVWDGKKLFTSKNYVAYELKANGPLRSSFTLDYADWNAGEKTVKEKKDISIDLGSNFTDYTLHVYGTDTITVGITLHDKKGKTSFDEKSAWFNYTTPYFGEVLSTSIVINPLYYAGHQIVKSDVEDESHLFVHLKVVENKVHYKAGFFWSKSSQFMNQKDWEKHLTETSIRIKNPLLVKIK